MRKLLLTLLVLAIVQMSFAQERTVTGKVTSSDDGSPLPGVNVVVKNTTNGTVTDADGNYKISLGSGDQSLVFSFIGLQTAEVAIGERTVVDVSLGLDVTQLSEVIVTAQGIQREKKALGYAVSTVSTDQIAQRPVQDLGRVLQGKIPGVTINPTGGASGVGSSINIRGYSTITGNTQPLWVVDGIPFNASTNDASGFTTGGTATSTSRFLDLDPNSIESINVLKGLAATVLYGDQGRNGVILVTTKAGSSKKKPFEVTFQQTYALNEIASLPEIQKDYGNGFQQLTNTTPFFSNWGAHYSEIDSVGHPYQFLADPLLRDPFASWTTFKRLPYRYSLDIGDFFRTGKVSNTSVSISGGTDKLNVSGAVGYTTEQGYAPGNDLKRVNTSLGFNALITDKLHIKSSLMFSNTDFQTPPLNGATGGSSSFGGVPSLYANFLYSPPNFDMFDPNGEFPWETPGDHRQVWYRSGNDIPNPIWLSKWARETDVTDRFFNSTSFTYDLSENFSVAYRVGLDTYTQRQNREYNKGVSATYSPIHLGILQTQTITNTIWNHDLIFNFQKELTPDINFVAQVGGAARNDYFQRDGLYSEGQTVFGLMRHTNFGTQAPVGLGGRTFYRTEEQQRYGVYGNFSFDYKDFLFLNLAARNDWVSMLEKGNNSLFYPSASVSVIATEALPDLKSNALSFLKFRFGYGTSAGFPNPYNTRTTVAQNSRGWVDVGNGIYPVHTVSNFLGNLGLKAELVSELEAGFEAKFFEDRIGVDFTIYDRSTKDLITLAPVDPATGYVETYSNIGKLSNKGIEIGLNATPLKLANGLRWDMIWNFTLVRPKVEELGPGLEEIVLAGFTDLGNFAVPGRPMNIIKGTVIKRAPDGQKVIGTDGLHVLEPIIGELGDPNPKYVTTLINSISFKGIALSVQLDFRKGGMMYGSTPSALLARGVLGGREQFNRDLAFILPGVKQVDTDDDGVVDSYAPNDIMLTAADYGFNSQFNGRNDNAMFDATNLRIREISLGYSLPSSLLSKTPLKAASITLTGNNLWYIAYGAPSYVNWDPEVASLGVNQGMGFDFLTGPSMRRYGAVLRVTF